VSAENKTALPGRHEAPTAGAGISTGVAGAVGEESVAEPDPRLLYANERTFLAWIRTSLALLAAGLAIIELLPQFRVAGGRRAVGLPLIALGTFLAAAAYRNWVLNDKAMRLGAALPRSRLALILAIGVGVVALLALVLSAFGR
jgi:putative membrane protein